MSVYKGDVSSASGKNWKEPSSSTISTEAQLNGDINVNKTLMAIKENKLDIKYIQIFLVPTEGAAENIGKGLHY